jgi:hypothetical protein
MTNTTNWYSTGLEGVKKFKEVEALRQVAAKTDYTRRFRLSPGEKGKVIFLDHPKVWLYQHSLQVDGRWESFTCTAEKESCPLCISGNRNFPILVATVLDTRKYTSTKNGKTYQYQKNLMVFKGKGIRAMMRQFLEGGKQDLTHYVLEIERDTDPKSVACGEYFTLDKKVSVPSLENLAKKMDLDPKEFLQPLDYFAILAPKTDKELRILAGMGEPVGGGDGDDLGDLDFGAAEAKEESLDSIMGDDPDILETSLDPLEETATEKEEDDSLDDLT